MSGSGPQTTIFRRPLKTTRSCTRGHSLWRSSFTWCGRWLFWGSIACHAESWWGGIAVATIVSLGAALFFSRTAPSAVFYLTPFRVYSLGAGALLALAGAPHRQWWTSSASAIGVGLLILQGTQVQGESSLLLTGVAATFATGLCILGSDSRFANAILAAPALVWLGRRSYSIYLVHWPLMVFWRLEFGRGSTVDRAEVIALSVVGGALMWSLVEQPVRLPSGAPQPHLWRSMSATVGLAASLGVFLAVLPIVDVQSPRNPDVSVTAHSPPVEVSPAQAVSTAPATGTATAGQATTGIPPPSTPPSATSGPPAEDVRLAALEDAVWRSARDNSRAIEARSAAVTMGACSFSNSDVPDGAYQVDRCAQGPADRPRYLVIGDSWAGDTFLAFSHAYRGVYFGLVSIAGCRPRLPGKFAEGELTACRNTYQFVFDHVATTDRFDGVILTGSWDQPFSDVTELALSFTGKGLRVFVVGMHARFGRSIADIILSSDSLAEVDTKARQLVEPWVHRSDTELMNGLPSSIGFIDFLELQCPEQSCTIYSPAGALLYVDPVHLSVEGARIVGDRLRQSNPKLF